MNFWLLMSSVAILDIAGISLGKYYILSKNPWIFGMSVICYGLMGGLLTFALNYKGLAITNVIWAALTIAIVTGIGYFYFKESISVVQGIGIVLVMMGIVLVNK